MDSKGKGKISPKKVQQVWRKKEPPQPQVSGKITTPVKMGGKGKKGQKKVKQVWRRKPPPWIELPTDITANILHRLGAIEILTTAEKVCRTWRNVCLDPSFWRVIDMRDENYSYAMGCDLNMMCRNAVDRSQGQLIDINIEFLTDHELLEYISNRCRLLKRLSVAECGRLSFCEAFSGFPLLEELSLVVDFISSECLELIGNTCPLLMSFSLHVQEPLLDSNDEIALTIAKSMPKLQHLRLFRNSLTNKGLEAILDGCPYLESLDLRQCCFVELLGDLGKRCSQQIKSLKCPTDPSEEDFDFYSEIYGNEFSFFPMFDSDFEDYLSYDDYTRWDPDEDEYWDMDDFFGFP